MSIRLPALQPARLLEVGELRHLHAIQPHFPAQPPRTECRRLPVVLDKADVMHLWVNTDGLERTQIEILKIFRRRLHDDLVLVVVLHSIGVFPIAAVRWSAAGLHISGIPRLRSDRA